MTATSPNTLGRALRGFFADHLPRVRGASPHTVRSYRDTFVLLLRFVVRPLYERCAKRLDAAELRITQLADALQKQAKERTS